jgi:nucleotide-binding universal stress UspA family protein
MKPPRAIILLANAGETPDPAPARTACDLARRGGARLFVVHVAPPGGSATGDAPPSICPGYAVLARLVAQCADAGGIVTRANLRLGAADAEILAEAGEIGAGLIVVAGRDRAPTQPQPGGELGDRLGCHAACPVLLVRDNEPGGARARLTLAARGATGARPLAERPTAAR